MSSVTSPRPVRRWVVVGLAALALAGAAIGLVAFFGGDEPEQVDAERALQRDQETLPGIGEVVGEGPAGELVTEEPPEEEGAEEPPEVEEPAAEPAAPQSPEELHGRWVVDRSRPFDREEGRGTFAGYRVQEELAGVGDSTAVGRTPDVDGEVVFDGATVMRASVEVDLTSLVSDDDRRDSRVRQELGPGATAWFELDRTIELPEIPPVGEVIELSAPGSLTILDTTEEVDVDLQAVVTETGLLVAGSTTIVLSDFGVEVPSATIVLSVSDEATLEWQLFLVREDTSG